MTRRENAHNADFTREYPCYALQGLAYSVNRWINIYTNHCKKSQQPAPMQSGILLFGKAAEKISEALECESITTTTTTIVPTVAP